MALRNSGIPAALLAPADPRAVALQSLKSPRGRYTAERASQLAGIPRNTIYEWRKSGIFVPDYHDAKPIGWSYRDLVYLRVLAFLRQQSMDRGLAAECVRALRDHVSTTGAIPSVTAARSTFMINDALAPIAGLQDSLLPADWLAPFNLTATVEDFGQSHLWGPDLVTPTPSTSISPWVLSGDPCIARTRVQTSSMFVLRIERDLDFEEIAELYPDITSAQAEDAYLLEMRLRGHSLFAQSLPTSA